MIITYKNMFMYDFKGSKPIKKIEIKSKHGRNQWECLCKCGDVFSKEETEIRKILKAGKIVQCRKCAIKANTEKRTLPSNLGEKRRVYLTYKNNARTRNLNFNLSEEEFYEIITKSCYYCGKEPYVHNGKPRNGAPFIRTGIDRIFSTKGYNIDNTISCCTDCNWMKKDTPQQEFINHIEKIYNNLKK